MGEVALRSRRRRIIDRPRLIRALDRTGAHVRALVASAGYGKTTLAEQWAGVPGRRAAWFRASRSAADVAVVARGLAAATAEILPEAGARMLERLAVTPDPDRDAALLAEMLAMDLAEWPPDAWVVVDDYQWVAESRASDTFVGTLAANAPVQLLVIGRTRPSWVTSRDVLYGNVLEIGRAALAMTEDEIDLVLGSARELAPGLLALAEGWPAVVALSSASTGVELQGEPEVPGELFDFFADEIFRRLDPIVQDGLCALAALPVVDEEVAHVSLGEHVAPTVLLEAVDLGIMDARGGRLELHPLAASFLQRRAGDWQPVGDSVITKVIDLYRRRGEWDAAFELANRRGTVDELEAVLREGVDQLLRNGRLATLESWLQAATGAEVASAALRVAEAELNLRHGRHFTALTLLEPDLADPPHADVVAFDVFSTAARAAHIAAKEHDALAYYERALERAGTREQRRAALEGQLMCAATLEMPVAHDLLEQLRATVDRGNAAELVRLADRTLSVGFRFGDNKVRSVAHCLELVPRITDPYARSSYLGLVSWGLVLTSDYESALRVASQAIDHANYFRLDVALPWTHGVRALALAGLKQFEYALEVVELSRRLAIEYSDALGDQNAYALRVRILVQQGRALEACALEPPEWTETLPFMRGEVMASRAVALAAIGRIAEAHELAEEARTVTSGVEAQVLVATARAVCASRTRSGSQLAECESMLELAFRVNVTDPLVTAMRGCPDLVPMLVGFAGTRERTIHVIHRAHDEHLLAACGIGVSEALDPLATLSAREREVYDLVCQGLSNSAIAKSLFISQSTVKVHVHHVFDKLGIRSRSALAVGAAVRGQAASAADATKTA